MKVQEFAEVGNSYAQTMDLAARDAHATALPWNPVPSEPKTLLVLTELTDEEYWSLVRKNFFRPVAELVKDILRVSVGEDTFLKRDREIELLVGPKAKAEFGRWAKMLKKQK